MGNTNDVGGISGGYDSDTEKYFEPREGGTAFDVRIYSKEYDDENANDAPKSNSTRSNSFGEPQEKSDECDQGDENCFNETDWL